MLHVREVALSLLLTLVGACASVSSPVAASRTLPEPSVGQLVYDADVTIHSDDSSLAVSTTLRYRVARQEEREMALLLNRALTVHSLTGRLVHDYEVKTSDFSPSWNLITVSFADSVMAGSIVDINIAYSGTPDMPDDGINRITPQWVELGLDSQWFPVVSTFAEDMIGTLRVALPQAWSLVASGASTTYGDTIVVNNHVPQVDVTFSAAPAIQVARRQRVEVHHRTAADSAVTAVLEAAGSCVQQLDTRFGARDTFPLARIVLAERDGPGYARKNYIVLSTVDAGDPEALHQFLCHEVAHYWTRSPGSFSPHHWMSESFAEYSAGMMVRERFGESAFSRLRDKWKAGGRAAGPVWTSTSTRRPSFQVMYRRGPWLISRLEERMGDDLFARFIARIMEDGVRTTPEMLSLLSSVAGDDVSAWFRDLLAAASDGRPD